jgi:Secretion system C-terminal sorting domain
MKNYSIAPILSGCFLSKKIAPNIILIAFLFIGNLVRAQGEGCNCTTIVGSGVGKPNLSTSGIILPQISGCIRVSGYLFLDVDFASGNQFTNVEFQMESGSQLIVSANTRVSFSGSTLHGCTTMWRHLAVLGTLEMDVCTVKDAQYAIRPLPGSVVNLSSNTFPDNWTGIYCVNLPGGMPFLSQNTFQSIGNLLPSYSGQLPAPGTKSRYGIYLTGSSNMSIGGTAAQTNYFNKLLTAVYVTGGRNTQIRTCVINGSNFGYLFHDGTIGVDVTSSRDTRVDNCSFQFLERGIQAVSCSGQFAAESNGPFKTLENSIDIDNFSIIQNANVDPIDIRVEDNFNVGSHFGSCIRVHHIHGSGKVSISGNPSITLGLGATSGTASVYGIEFSDYNGLTGSASITGNDVSLGGINQMAGAVLVSNVPINTFVLRNLIHSGSSGVVDFGILAANTRDCRIVDNTINGITVGQDYSLHDAIRLDMSESSILCCNRPDNSTFGVTYLGPNTSDIANTDFKHHLTRLSLYQVPGMGVQTHNGNSWAFNDPGKVWDAKYEGVLSQTFFSKFYVDPVLLPDLYNKIEVVGGTLSDKQNWFEFEEGGRVQCEIEINIPPTPSFLCGFDADSPGFISENDTWALESNSDPSLAAMKWESQRQLYDKLLREPGLINHNEDVSSFYTGSASGAIGQYRAFAQALNDIYAVPASLGSGYQTALDSFNQLSETLQTVESNLSTETYGSSAYELLLAERSDLLAQLEPVNTLLSEYDTLLAIECNVRINDLLTSNLNLPGNEIFHDNERAINAVLLQAYLSQNWNFNSESRAIINGVASQCPLSGGRAVYKARSLQSYYQRPDWGNDNCLTIGERSEHNRPQQLLGPEIFDVFPVPATDRLVVKFESRRADGFRLRIFDTQGVLKVSQEVTPGATECAVDLSTFPTGLYLIECQGAEEKMSVKKFTVIK